jgi:hypothetical protein
MALQDPMNHTGRLVNVSSDDPNGRATGSNLAVFALANDAPKLLLARTNSPAASLVISWPAAASGWRLQQNSGLKATNWTNVSAPVHKLGDSMQVILAPQGANGFYRLTK